MEMEVYSLCTLYLFIRNLLNVSVIPRKFHFLFTNKTSHISKKSVLSTHSCIRCMYVEPVYNKTLRKYTFGSMLRLITF